MMEIQVRLWLVQTVDFPCAGLKLFFSPPGCIFFKFSYAVMYIWILILVYLLLKVDS